MFETLLETRARRMKRSTASTIASVAIHSAMIVGTMAAAAVGGTPPPTVRDPKLIYIVDASKPDRPVRESLLRPVATVPLPGAVCDCPEMPALQFPPSTFDPPSGPAIDAEMVFAPGGSHSRSPGPGTTDGVPDGGGLWMEAAVEKPALALPGSPLPVYPDILRRAGVAGEVVAQFVVDTTGRVEPGSFRVIRETQPLFAPAVERVLPWMRFVPAEVGGRRVRQLVQQSFVFAIER